MIGRSLTPVRVALFALAFAFYAPAALGQMPQPDTSNLLSSSDVSEEQIQKVARIVVAIRTSTQSDRMKMQKEMKEKYGNPQQMDSTQKAMARKEMRRRQMKMRKKQMKIMRQQAEEEGMEPKMFQQIMQSTRQDSTLEQRIQMAMKKQMKMQQQQQGQMQNPNQQNQ